MYDLIFNIENCYYSIPHLIYYSHIGSAAAALIVGIFVITNNPKDLRARLLFLLTLTFVAWTALDLVTWVGVNSAEIMFSWSTLIVADMMLYILGFYLLYAFLFKRDLPGYTKFLVFLPILPIVLLANTPLNVEHFDTVTCNAIDGFLAETYLYGVEFIIYLFMIATVLWYAIKQPAGSANLREGMLFSLGLLSYLGIFLGTNTLASYCDTNEFLWSLTQYSLFGMVFFMAALSYLIVTYQSFNVKLVSTQALVGAVTIIVGSQLLFVENDTNRLMIVLTLILTSIGGLFLVRSVMREIKQREEIETLAKDLEKANVRLKELDKQKSEFVSIASHQLRSPLTSIRGYASLLLEGSFGDVPKRAIEPIERIETSAKHMAIAVEDYLNISRIESGNMKYEKQDFNFVDEIIRITDDVRPTALKKGLVLLYRSDHTAKGVINADLGKTVQIVHNLINNAIKYTEKGTITVFVREDLKKKEIYMDVIDTGVGMSQKTIHKLFQKFSRADDANKVNTGGTGLGLYVADQMAEAMGGNIDAFSEGEGKGSRFTLTMPLAM